MGNKNVVKAAAAGFLVGNLIIFGTLYINSILFMAIFCLMGTGIMHATARTFHKKWQFARKWTVI